MARYEYDFEAITVSITKASFIGGAGLTTDKGYRDIVRRRAAEGWRLAACVPIHQRAGGWTDAWDLVFEREL